MGVRRDPYQYDEGGQDTDQRQDSIQNRQIVRFYRTSPKIGENLAEGGCMAYKLN
jgi:hypothetical protein